MPDEGKAFFCQLLSSLFCSPDQETVEQIFQGTLHSYFKTRIESWGEDTGILIGFLARSASHALLRDLKEEYHRLFSDTGNERISLVESFYKPWTQDPHCPIPFAKEKGLLMGDSAIHLSTLFQQCGMEVAGPFKGMPDHVVIELEFLSYLYQEAGDKQIKRFVEDHLDWVPSLKESMENARAHPFYISLIGVLDLFIDQEKKRLETESDGKKDIHPDVV